MKGKALRDYAEKFKAWTLKKVIDKKEEKASIQKMAEEMAGLLNDRRYPGMKDLLNSYMELATKEQNMLPYVETDINKLIVKTSTLAGEINMCERILNTPNMFIERLKELENDK